MTDTIRQYIQQHRMILPGGTVCVGLSGGADSVCLLLVLLELYCSPDSSVRVRAVHINHQLRGESADADERFVRELCSRNHVPLQIFRYPVAEIAEKNGTGTEEAGRMVRHEAYRKCLEGQDTAVIALAHHANDCAETFLFHAARGSSLAGLAGIRPVQPFSVPGASSPGAAIIRPLLCVTRREIEEWLSARGQTWRTDETNLDQSFSRNTIRHSVIPFLEEHINTEAVRHMAEACADLDEADRFLKAEARQRAGRYVQQRDGEIRVAAALQEQPAVLQGCILLDILEKIGGERKDLGREQVRQLQELFRMQTGRRIDLPYSMRAEREYEGIRIFRRNAEQPAEDPETMEKAAVITGPGTYIWNDWRFSVRVREAPWKETPGGFAACADEIPRNKYTKWLDCDKIDGNLCIRSRRNADRLVINAQGGSRKLKAYLIDEKVPAEERDAIPLLASGTRILWVVGRRISEDAKVTEQTRKIMEITAEYTGKTDRSDGKK